LKNVELLEQLKSGEITPQTLAFMTHQEMNQMRWKELIEQKIKRDANKYTTNIQASTDMFTCRKCKSKRCTYYELQTRSADEPATIFVTCLDCGKNWKS
jgi:transcription elongation factor S-II